MTEQSSQEQTKAFLKKHVERFNKYIDDMIEADARLEALDYEGFELIFAKKPQEELAEIAMAQHLKTNEIFGIMKQRHESMMTILHDISNCKDFVAFDALKKRARVVLMAQDMVDRGKPVDEVLSAVDKANEGSATSNIIVQ